MKILPMFHEVCISVSWEYNAYSMNYLQIFMSFMIGCFIIIILHELRINILLEYNTCVHEFSTELHEYCCKFVLL